MKSFMRVVFGTPSSKEGNKSPSLELDAKVVVATSIEKIIEALEPEKVAEEAIVEETMQSTKALELKDAETKALEPHESKEISLREGEDIELDFN